MVALGVFMAAPLAASSVRAQGAQEPGAEAQAGANAASTGSAASPSSEAAAPPKAIGLTDSGTSTATTAPTGAPEARQPFYPDRYPPPEVRWKTLGLGAGLVAVGYGLALGTSYLWDGAPGMRSLRTPVIGPIGAIADGGCGDSEGANCTTVTVVLRALLAGISGLAQVGGIGVLTEGVVMKTQERPVPAAQRSQWYALPAASKSGASVTVGVTF